MCMLLCVCVFIYLTCGSACVYVYIRRVCSTGMLFDAKRDDGIRGDNCCRRGFGGGGGMYGGGSQLKPQRVTVRGVASPPTGILPKRFVFCLWRRFVSWDTALVLDCRRKLQPPFAVLTVDDINPTHANLFLVLSFRSFFFFSPSVLSSVVCFSCSFVSFVVLFCFLSPFVLFLFFVRILIRTSNLSQKTMRKGINKFNVSPKEGIAFLVEEGLLDDSAEGICGFLCSAEGLSKRRVGEYFGRVRTAALETDGQGRV